MSKLRKEIEKILKSEVNETIREYRKVGKMDPAEVDPRDYPAYFFNIETWSESLPMGKKLDINAIKKTLSLVEIGLDDPHVFFFVDGTVAEKDFCGCDDPEETALFRAVRWSLAPIERVREKAERDAMIGMMHTAPNLVKNVLGINTYPIIPQMVLRALMDGTIDEETFLKIIEEPNEGGEK